MCGYIFSISKSDIDAEKALEMMRHRGPDAAHIVKRKVHGKNITFGHVRLSVHDLSDSADQPFFSSCGRYILVFNGEIYNYKELKEKLLPEFTLRSDSDTEVLLQLLVVHGEKILNNLDGMFSLVFVDLDTAAVLIARDQLGVKPCYYTVQDNCIFVASEIKALFSLSGVTPQVSKKAFYEFMRNSFVYEPETGFENVYKLSSGHYVGFKIGEADYDAEMYWHPTNKELNREFQVYEEVASTLCEKVKKSCQLQQEADVPVGLFFSGGVDSTILLLNILKERKVDILSVKTDAKQLSRSGVTDDFHYAEKISGFLEKKIKPIEFEAEISSDKFLEEVEKCAVGIEELVADFTYSVSSKLSFEARKNNSVVMLSGMGADEIFAGYEKYRLVLYRNLYSLIYTVAKPFLKKRKSFAKKLSRLEAFLKTRSFVDGYSNMLGYFSGDELDDVLLVGKEEKGKYLDKLNMLVMGANNDLQKAMLLDHRGFMQHNFTVGDKSSMRESIELRVPLATKSLMEYSFSMRPSALIDFRQTKKTLRRLLKGIVPSEYMERKKAGFHPPMDDAVFGLGEKRVYDLLSENLIGEFISDRAIKILLNQHYSREKNNTYKIFQLIYFSYWYKNFILEYKS